MWIFLLAIITSTWGHVSVQHKAITDCIQAIVMRYFYPESLLFIVDEENLVLDFEAKLEPDLKEEIKWWTLAKLTRYMSVQIVSKPLWARKQGTSPLTNANTIIFIDSYLSDNIDLLQQVFQDVKDNIYFEPKGKVLIVIPQVTDKEPREAAALIMESFWKVIKLLHFTAMVTDTEGYSEFFTFTPYADWFLCTGPTKDGIVKLDTWKNGRFKSNSTLFPEKILNDVSNCKLVAVTQDCEPYVMKNHTEGIELYLIDSLTQHLHFRLYLTTVDDFWTIKNPNGQLTGALGVLDRQEADFAFSCFMLTSESYNFGESMPAYFDDGLTWFVPTPALKSHTSDIISAFPVTFWGLIVLSLFFVIAAVMLIVFVEGLNTSSRTSPTSMSTRTVQILAMSVNTAIPYRDPSWLLRFLFIIYIIYSIHITTAFQSSLFSRFKTSAYSKIYTHIKQCVDDGLFTYLRPTMKFLYNQTDFEIWNRILQLSRHGFVTEKNANVVFRRIQKQKDAVALYTRSGGLYKIRERYTTSQGRPEILTINEDFSLFPVTIYMSLGHPLYDQFKTHIMYVIASGLNNFWFKRGTGRKRDHTFESAENVPLSMEHLSGAFAVLILLLGISVLIFMLELFIFNLKSDLPHDGGQVRSKKKEKSMDKEHKTKLPTSTAYTGPKPFAGGQLPRRRRVDMIVRSIARIRKF